MKYFLCLCADLRASLFRVARSCADLLIAASMREYFVVLCRCLLHMLMQTGQAQDRPEWQKAVAGCVNASTVESQRLSASLASCGAAAQLVIDDSTQYTAVHTLAPPASQLLSVGAVSNSPPVPTVHIYLSTDPPDSETRSYMLVQRLTVPVASAETVSNATQSAAAESAHSSSTDSAAVLPLCLSKMFWAGPSALALLYADGRLVVLASGIRASATDDDEESSGEDDVMTSSAPTSCGSRHTLLLDAHRVVDVATTSLTRGAQQLVVILAAHHTHTTVTVLDTAPRAEPGRLYTADWPAVGPFRGLVALSPFGAGSSCTLFAGYDAMGCLSLFEWSVPDVPTSAACQTPVEVPPPRCVRQCVLGPHVHPLGLAASSPTASAGTSHIVLVGLKAASVDVAGNTASSRRAPDSARGVAETLLLRGKDGSPLAFDEAVQAQLRAASHTRDPLNQVYAALHTGGVAAAPSSLPSFETLEQLGALRIVRPRLTAETLLTASLSVLDCAIVAADEKAANLDATTAAKTLVTTRECTLPLKDHREALDTLLSHSRAGADPHHNRSRPDSGGLLLYPFTLSARSCAESDGSAPVVFILYNARGLVSFALNSSGCSDVHHVWSSSQPIARHTGSRSSSSCGPSANGLVGGIAHVALASSTDSGGDLHGVLLRGTASCLPPQEDDGDTACHDPRTVLARTVTLLDDLKLTPVRCVKQQRTAHDGEAASENHTLRRDETEALIRRVVCEEISAAVGPLEARLTRMETMLQAILDRMA